MNSKNVVFLFETNRNVPDTGGGCDCGGGGPEVEAAVSPNLLAGMGVGR